MSLLLLGLPLIEFSLNNILALDAEVFSRFDSLTGKIIAVDVEGMPITLYLLPNTDGIQLRDSSEHEADATIQGTPIALLKSLSGRYSNDIRVQGDVALVQDFQAILQHIDIDWEEQLSHFCGDIFAHKVGDCARGLREKGQRIEAQLTENMGEYLQEECRLLPPEEELKDFYHDVDVLRADAERCEQRVQRLISLRVA